MSKVVNGKSIKSPGRSARVDRKEFLSVATGLASAAWLAGGGEAAAAPTPVNWVFINTSGKEQRNHFIKAMRGENVNAEPMGGSAILPIATHIEKKETLQPFWPSFTVGRGKTIQYGASACPRTIDICDRYVGIPMDPEFSDQDVAAIITAVRKVYPAVMNA